MTLADFDRPTDPRSKYGWWGDPNVTDEEIWKSSKEYKRQQDFEAELNKFPSSSGMGGYADPKTFLRDYLYPSDREGIIGRAQQFPGFVPNEEEMLLAQGQEKPKRRLADLLPPGGQNAVWTDIPGKMFFHRGDYGLMNVAPGRENKKNLLRSLPNPEFRTYISEPITPYFKQFGPRQPGTGSI